MQRAFEIDGTTLTAQTFQTLVVARGQPAILRGLVRDWPAIQASQEGSAALATYLRTFSTELPLQMKSAPPEVEGRFFYDAGLTGVNFEFETLTLPEALERLISAAGIASAPSLAVQSVQLEKYLPGFEAANSLALLPREKDARAWINTACTVGTHYDQSENLACVVAGRRRFTMFPPDQVANLYPGPFEQTPARPVSLVDLSRPDLDRYPRFASALEHGVVADLEAGDAIYLPYMW